MAGVADQFCAPKVVGESLVQRCAELDVFVVDDSLNVVEYKRAAERALEADDPHQSDYGADNEI